MSGLECPICGDWRKTASGLFFHIEREHKTGVSEAYGMVSEAIEATRSAGNSDVGISRDKRDLNDASLPF